MQLLERAAEMCKSYIRKGMRDNEMKIFVSVNKRQNIFETFLKKILNKIQPDGMCHLNFFFLSLDEESGKWKVKDDFCLPGCVYKDRRCKR